MPAQQPSAWAAGPNSSSSASTSGVSTPKTAAAPSLHAISTEDLPGGGLPPPASRSASLPPGLPPGLKARAEPERREAPRRAGSGSRLATWGISPDEAEEPDAPLGALGVGGLLGPMSIPGRAAALAADVQQPLSPSSNLRSMLGVNGHAADGVASLGGSLAHLGFGEQRPAAAQSPSRLASWCCGDEPSSGAHSSASQLPGAILGELPPAGGLLPSAMLPSAILPGMGSHVHQHQHQASAQQEQAQLHHLLQLQAQQAQQAQQATQQQEQAQLHHLLLQQHEAQQKAQQQAAAAQQQSQALAGLQQQSQQILGQLQAQQHNLTPQQQQQLQQQVAQWQQQQQLLVMQQAQHQAQAQQAQQQAAQAQAAQAQAQAQAQLQQQQQLQQLLLQGQTPEQQAAAQQLLLHQQQAQQQVAPKRSSGEMQASEMLEMPRPISSPTLPDMSKLVQLTADEARSHVLNPDTNTYDYYIDHRDYYVDHRNFVIVRVEVKKAAESNEHYNQRKRNRHTQTRVVA